LEKYKKDERVLEELCYWIKEFKKNGKPISEFFKLFSLEEVVNFVFKDESIDMPKIMAKRIATISFYIGIDEALLVARLLSNFEIRQRNKKAKKGKEMFYKAIKIFSSEEFVKAVSKVSSKAIMAKDIAYYTGFIISYTNDEKAARTFLDFILRYGEKDYEKFTEEASKIAEVAIKTKDGNEVIKEIKKLEEEKLE
jgi:hypothetical protein